MSSTLTKKELEMSNADLKERTVAQLRSLLDKLGTSYTSSELKPELIKKVRKGITEEQKKKKKFPTSPNKDKKKKDDKEDKDSPKRPKEKLAAAPSWPKNNPSPEEYKLWKKEFTIYNRIATNQGHSDDAIYLQRMESLPAEIKQQVFAELDDDDMNTYEVLDILERDYKGIESVIEDKVRREYRSLKKKDGESLGEYVKRYRTTRARALSMKVIQSSSADAGDFLESCQLTMEQRTAIAREMRREKLTGDEEKLTFALKEVNDIEELYGLIDNEKGKKKDEKKTFWTAKGPGKGNEWYGGEHKGSGKSKGKNKAKKGKGKGKGGGKNQQFNG